jgi:phosphoglycolate phosphatase
MKNSTDTRSADLPPLRAVIFDLDGTLSESAPAIARGLAATWRSLGRPEPSLAAVRAMIGDGPGPLVERARAAADLPDDAAATREETALFLDFYAREGHGGDPFPGALDVLAALAALGLKLAVCTNKPQIAAEKLLRGLGFWDYLEGVVGGDAVTDRKPHPAHVEAALALVGDIPPEAAILVGDGPQDIGSGEAAGLDVIVAAYGYGGVAEARPDLAAIQDIKELPDVLERLRSLPG